MNYQLRTKSKSLMLLMLICTAGLFFGFSKQAQALTPIANTDVVPNQRIEHGTTFNFGVVAFSKAGIDRVDFVISGQGYSGGIKTSTEMTLNTRVASVSPGAVRDGVWEYHVPIAASEFTSNGTITVTPTAYGDDADTKVLDAVTLYVEGASDESPTEAWVDPWDNDGAGTLNNDTDPYPTIASAVAAIEGANGNCDYATIYLAEGTYDDNNEFGTGSIITTAEYLIIRKEASATRENVIIAEDHSLWNGAGYVKFEDVSFSEDGTWMDYALHEDADFWFHKCNFYGPGGWNHRESKPVPYTKYCTDSYFTGVPIVLGQNVLARGVRAYETTDDWASYLAGSGASDVMHVNCEWEKALGDYYYQDASHSDIWQQDYGAIDNMILYNFVGTDLQYQGFFMDQDTSIDNTNVAFVNVLIEFGIQGETNLRSWLYDNWDHLLIWHMTVGGRHENQAGNYDMIMGERADCDQPHRVNNLDIVGSVFHEYRFMSNTMNSSDLASGNSYGNTVNHNHFSTGSTYGEDHTTGSGMIDYSSPSSASFAYPSEGSVIIDAIPSGSTVVPSDAYGNPRDSTPDLGALEYDSGSSSNIRSDVDNSGSSNTTDAQLTLRYSLALDMSQTAWYNSATTGDADCSGTANSTDALLILRNSLGLDMGSTAWCGD